MARIALIVFGMLSLVAAASLRAQTVKNAYGFANSRSLEFAKGDSGDSSGWRPCVEAANQAQDVGLVCEGLRQIRVHGGKLVDVNYFCEFRFLPVDAGFRLEHQHCQ